MCFDCESKVVFDMRQIFVEGGILPGLLKNFVDAVANGRVIPSIMILGNISQT